MKLLSRAAVLALLTAGAISSLAPRLTVAFSSDHHALQARELPPPAPVCAPGDPNGCGIVPVQ